jgi:hypothetical protein
MARTKQGTTRLGLFAVALSLAAGCSEMAPTDPSLLRAAGPLLNEQEGPTSGAKVCKVGPAGTYNFTASSTGGGTLLFTNFSLAAGTCEWIWVGTDPSPLTTITVAEVNIPSGIQVTSIEVRSTMSDVPTVLTGTSQASFKVDATNSATVIFTNGETPPSGGGEGCTPGYWKQSQHFDSWVATGFATTTKVGDVFAGSGAYKVGSTPASKFTLLQALSFPDDPGSSVDGAAQLLLRAAVAALLNAGNPDVSFGMTTAEVISAVEAALATKDRATILALQQELDDANNQGCPLN